MTEVEWAVAYLHQAGFACGEAAVSIEAGGQPDEVDNYIEDAEGLIDKARAALEAAKEGA